MMVADLVVVVSGAPVVFRDGEVIDGVPGFTATARESSASSLYGCIYGYSPLVIVADESSG